MEKFDVGDIVTLKGYKEPKMVIANIKDLGANNKYAECHWFATGHFFNSHGFHVLCLHKDKIIGEKQ